VINVFLSPTSNTKPMPVKLRCHRLSDG